jgi:carbon monoxide dehydrogenase subunit G
VAFEVDEVARIGRITGRGKDATGGTRARMAFGFAVRPEGDATVVTGEGTVDIRGPLAGLIESGASVVVRRMLSEILARLTERCARPAVPEGGRDDPPPLADGGRLQRLTGWPTARGRAE